MIKKKIVLNNGRVFETEFNEKFVQAFKPLCVKVFKKYKNGNPITEDEFQELDILLYEAFLKYDEKHCFTTLLFWEVRGYGANKINAAKTKKRDMSAFQFISLDKSTSNDKGDRETNYGEVVEYSDVNIEEDFIDKNFITFLMSNLNDFEKDLLQANLKNIAFKDICIKYEMKKTTISNRNWKFKEKIKGLIELYNK